MNEYDVAADFLRKALVTDAPMESDVEFAHWLGMRWPHKPRMPLFIPPRVLRERAYDEETDQMVMFLRAEHATAEQRQRTTAMQFQEGEA